MSIDPNEVQAAFARATGWLASANAVALLRAAYRHDVLRRLAEPTTADELAAAIGCSADRALLFCQALEAHEVIERDGERYRTAAAWLALDDEGRPLLLRELVGANEVLQRGIADALDGGRGFAEVSADESLALARLAWGRPHSEAARQMWRQVDRQMPEVVKLWEGGGSYAEFGCGVGRDLLRVATMYPRVHVTGYDLMSHLIEECRAQAEHLGIGDRVTLVQGDVSRLELDRAYDTLMWSQMFFGPDARPPALAAISRALRPGGFLLMPLMPPVVSPPQTDTTPATRGLLLARIAYARWEIQWSPADAVRAEVERAGFRFVRELPNARTPYLLFAAP